MRRERDDGEGGVDERAGPERQAEEEAERHRRAEHLLQVGAHHRDLHVEVEGPRHPHRVRLAHGLGEVAPGDDAVPRRELLQHQRHDGRPEHHPRLRERRVRAELQVGLEVARVDVRERHEEAGAERGEEGAQRESRPLGRRRRREQQRVLLGAHGVGRRAAG